MVNPVGDLDEEKDSVLFDAISDDLKDDNNTVRSLKVLRKTKRRIRR